MKLKKLIVGINSQYIHSSLSIRSLGRFIQGRGMDIDIMECTINQPIDMIEAEIINRRPDFIGFSTYIWNQEMVVKLLPVIRRVLPQTIIVVGGPEASYENIHYFDLGADYLISGEGEMALYKLLSFLETGSPRLADIPRLVYPANNEIKQNKQDDLIDLDSLVFPYDEADINPHQIYYYQGSRGCPYRCAYCLSSNPNYEGKYSRYKSMEKIKEELLIFINGRVKQVKFIDRTFNANGDYAREIWLFLMEHDNGYTNFHFEMGADLLTPDCIALLSQARMGLFQFEVGIQSTNLETLAAVGRYSKLEKVFQGVADVISLGNIHIHVDLIAGLPKEDYKRFKKSFNDVFKLQAPMLQLGFLKLLPGTKLYNDRELLGLEARNYPPYEVFQTRDMPYEHMAKLKNMEQMVEMYLNSGQFHYSLQAILPFFPSPFDFLEDLAGYFSHIGEMEVKQKRIRRYEILYSFARDRDFPHMGRLRDSMAIDLMERDRVILPLWLSQETSEAESNAIRDFYGDTDYFEENLPNYAQQTSGQRSRQLPILSIEHPVLESLNNNTMINRGKYHILFDYNGRDTFRYSKIMDITQEIEKRKARGN